MSVGLTLRCMTPRLLDTYAPRFDITQTQVVMVDAHPATVAAALETLPLSNTAAAAIEALGITDRLAAGPAQLAARGAYERVYGLLWRLAPGAPGHINVIWDVDVRPGADDGAVLASTVRFVATDDPARASLLTAWGLVGAIATVLSKRALATVRAYAEEHGEPAFGASTVLVAS